MAKQKSEPQTTPSPQQLVEAKVDRMMDISPAPSDAQPLDIFAGQGAPTLPGKPTHHKSVPEVITPTATETVVKVETQLDTSNVVLTEPEIGPLNIDTPQTDAAIQDIVTQEADEVLAAQDAGIEAAVADADTVPEEPAPRGHPVFWFIMFVLVVLIILGGIMLTSPGLSPSFAP